MKNIDLYNDSAVVISRHIIDKDISVSEVLEHVIMQQARQNNEINAFLDFEPEIYRAKAKIVQEQIDFGNAANNPLSGMMVAIKDNICTKGVPTTCASNILANFIPPYSAHVIDKLESNLMIMTGKCNMDEFAMGSTSETGAFGVVRNPWNNEYSAGGSSGGSVAAVASGMAYLALGSDTGGSVRQPASFCGVSGLKPTYGSVSRYGLIAYASSLDQIGPIAVHVEDVAALLDGIQGPDMKDSTCIIKSNTNHYNTLIKSLEESTKSDLPLRGRKIAVLSDSQSDKVSPDVRASVKSFVAKIEELGGICEEVKVDSMRFAVPAYYILAGAEASSNLARYDGVKYGAKSSNATDLSELYFKTRTENFGNEVMRRILLGSFVLSSGYFDAYYMTALKIKGLIKRDFDKVLLGYDAVLCPTSQDTAPKLGESLKDPLKMYLNDIFTVTANMTGLPALSIPSGFDSKGLPIGMQLMGKAFDEDTLLFIAGVYQKNTDFHTKKPSQALNGGKTI